MRFKAKEIIPGLIVILLICGTYLYLSRPREIFGDPNGIVPLVMPQYVGEYEAHNILFCMNDQCARAFEEQELYAAKTNSVAVVSDAASTNGVETINVLSANVCDTGCADPCETAEHVKPKDDAGDSPWPPCPICGTRVSPISIGETKLLPSSTPIFRKLYRSPGSQDLQTTFVFSGMERRSIHRPQVCLVGQGNRITNEFTYDIELPDGKTLPIKILEISQAYTESDGTKRIVLSIYAYWFFNPERETPEHLTRFLYMSLDNAFRNYRPRWAYASIAFNRDMENPDSWKAALDNFIPKLYPTIEELRAEMKKRGEKSVTVIRSGEANTYDKEADTFNAPINTPVNVPEN